MIRTDAGNRIYALRFRKSVALFFVLALLLTSCGAGSLDEKSAAGGGSGGYQVPEMKTAAFHADQAEGGYIDLSAVSEGYVAVAADSDSRLKFQVIKGDTTYTYDMASDGTPSVFPIQSGNGTYEFKIMENIVDTKYAEYYAATADVSLSSEFEPFLRPSDYANYSKDSKCVKKAEEFSKSAGSAMDVVAAVYEYVTSNVKYDRDKAKSVASGYLPDPDETFATNKGICFDYASLAAAMLRSQGIPAKVVFGYVSPDDLYHAWNMFYTEETGWVTAKFEVDKNTWNRIDLTFAASGTDMKFIGDGSNYSDVYYY